ncbi:uncharacterized protein VDAG_09224 [Verticillium dahliae VdLs.17]|uniref:Uncharacterized protein n=1 Tax=Verticillium dahliae (strain VdLs.17 / ATCC MYA-4575 / FGSC 10137) TaxID=498257 RepID=G2XFV0_VERDV|nr:uncharacterized protein VDAG_09224 [Verticillium dahliae VdLs.17]EGY18698.1 hypothetical protein VDAG_09224 [Verticillium dahliae VdLs.17]
MAISTISSVLAAAGWSKKTVRRMAQERNADLCDFICTRSQRFCYFESFSSTNPDVTDAPDSEELGGLRGV